METLVRVNREWIKNEEDLMQRLAAIVAGIPEDWQPIKKTDGYRWQLDPGNNYWAEIRDDQLVLASRYGGEKFETLVKFVAVWLV